jgi:hypothetical protein
LLIPFEELGIEAVACLSVLIPGDLFSQSQPPQSLKGRRMQLTRKGQKLHFHINYIEK